MTEPVPAADSGGAAGAAPKTAGALLRAAREREGLHVAVLAATIKVAPAKLQALEQDQYGQLPNATFTRALAQSVCRSLKIDPRPVLALLPQLESLPLEGAGARLNTPFDDRPGRSDGAGLAWASKPMFWAGGVLLIAALAVAFVPPALVERWTSQVGAVVPAASAPASAVASVMAAASQGLAAAVAVAASAPAPTASQPTKASPEPEAAKVPQAPAPPVPGAGLLQLAATADSWIEVLDAQGQSVFSRILTRGETVAVDASPPLRVRVGNAAGTSVAFRGQSLDLAPYTRDNVARLELR